MLRAPSRLLPLRRSPRLSRPLSAAPPAPLVLRLSKNGVSTLIMNNPDRLNGWTRAMLTELFLGLEECRRDEGTKASGAGYVLELRLIGA